MVRNRQIVAENMFATKFVRLKLSTDTKLLSEKEKT